MLHEAGFAFINLVPAWGHSVSPELLASQDARFISDAMFLREFLVNGQSAWNQIAEGRRFRVRREDVPFQVLDPAAAASFPVEEAGDVLMLTVEEQELLGNVMVIRLRLAQVRPRESDSDVSRPDPKRRRGSPDAPLSIPYWPGSDEGARAWGGPVSETVGTSSLASGDAPMLTPDENMSSVGGGSQGSPGLGPAGAVAHVFVATAGPEGDSSVSVEQPTVYVPVAAYPPTPALTAPPDLSTAVEATYPDDEESKPGAPASRKSDMSRSTEADVAEHALRVAQQQVADLQAAMSMNRSERKQFKSIHRGREIKEARHKEAADTDIARLQLRLYQIQEQQAQDLAASHQEVEAQLARERVASHREVEAIARDAERFRVEAAAAARARQEEAQSKRELEYQLREAHVWQVIEMERREVQEAEIKALLEQVAAASARHHPQERSSSPTPGGGVRAGAPQLMRRQQLRRSNGRNGIPRTEPDRPPEVQSGSGYVPPSADECRTRRTKRGGATLERPRVTGLSEPGRCMAVCVRRPCDVLGPGSRRASGRQRLRSARKRISPYWYCPCGVPDGDRSLTTAAKRVGAQDFPRSGDELPWGIPRNEWTRELWRFRDLSSDESQVPGPTALPNSTSGFSPRWPPAEPRGYPSEIPSQATTWNSSLGGTSTVPAPRGDTFQWGHTAQEAQSLPRGYPPGTQFPCYGFRSFIAYDAVEPIDPTLSLEKRRLWWDKFQYTALMGGWREQERCTRLYSRLSHNEGTKAWIQQLSDSVRRSWQQLSDKVAKEFCRSTESPVERYVRLKQEARETPRTFLWILNAAAVKANVIIVWHRVVVAFESVPEEFPRPRAAAESAGPTVSLY
ncbi:hypothetical protein PHYPSEUDO_000505 [Phytophthora pseudosyringae]|uniref:Uncharacterized protein n=1 Tax=Phytophthora pseudosyringae TaxID=221518 RepID=A0A8T1V6A0_9STRA|nr:hypothetical protein PHYPSEUDO_000505 [Phytophthora pseudosyringae]